MFCLGTETPVQESEDDEDELLLDEDDELLLDEDDELLLELFDDDTASLTFRR